MAEGKKNAIRLRALIAFIDESGVMMAPLLQRTWSPRGVTPIVTHRTRHRAKVSAIAAVVLSPHLRRTRLYFRLHPNGSIHKAELIAFLRQLRNHIRGPIIVVWDRLKAHRSSDVDNYCRRHRIRLELLPGYAPELNPVEYVWSYLKTKQLANFVAHDIDELATATRTSAKRVQSDVAIVRSFAKHSPLFF